MLKNIDNSGDFRRLRRLFGRKVGVLREKFIKQKTTKNKKTIDNEKNIYYNVYIKIEEILRQEKNMSEFYT